MRTALPTSTLRSVLAALLVLLAAGGALAQSAGKASGEKVAIPSMTCVGQPFVCSKLEVPGWLFVPAGASAVVVINHGSQGIDQRIFEYADALNRQGMGALVLDHWTPRGISDTHSDYAATEKLGGNPLGQATDTAMAIDWLKANRPQFTRFGSIGESLGGGTAQQLAKAWIYPMLDQQAGGLYGRAFRTQPPDALVGLYGSCAHRSEATDKFVARPLLLISGELDDETPSRFCQQYIPWMNARGGRGEILVLPGVGHSFDAPYPRRRVMERQFANCDFLVKGNQVTLTTTGETLAYTPTNYAALRQKCSAMGFTSGSVGDRFVAVPHWTAFLRKHLTVQ